MTCGATPNDDELFFDVHSSETIGAVVQGVVVVVVDVVEVDDVVVSGTVDVVLVVDVVDDVVVVTATNCGSFSGPTGTGFGQYRDGYPSLSRGSPTYSKCIPSAGQKLPPQANPHLRKI